MNYFNFETEKLLIQNPTLSNAIIFFVIFCVAAVTVTRQKNNFLDRVQTEQLKGIGILFVVTGHLWSHVSFGNAMPNFSRYAVALFLVLSGYGLSRSWQQKPLTFTEFAGRRIGRVLVPYWIATVCILILDYCLLDRQYSIVEIVSTFCGANFPYSLRHLDYARWYITLILIFYCVFFGANKFFDSLQAVLGLFVFSLLLFVLRRTEVFPFGQLFHFVAFPIGCLVACFDKRIRIVLTNNSTLPMATVLLVTLLGAMLCGILLPGLNRDGTITTLLNILVGSAKPLLLCAFLICVFGLMGIFNICSRFFMFCGMVSYEVYLLHGPFLIKYNPIFPYFTSDYIVVGYLIFLLFILVLSYLFKLCHEYMFNVAGKLFHFQK